MQSFAGRRDRFACVPAFWIPLLHGQAEHSVVISILSYADKQGYSQIGLPRIRDDTGLSQRTIQRAIERLVKRGLFTLRSGKGRGHVSEYWAHITEDDFKKVVTRMTPFIPPKKVSNGDIKGVKNRHKSGHAHAQIVPISKDQISTWDFETPTTEDEAAFEAAMGPLREKLFGQAKAG